MNEGDEEALTQAISVQCVSVGIDASLPTFQFYSCKYQIFLKLLSALKNIF